MKLLTVIASLLGVAFIGCLAWALITSGELNDTRETLVTVQAELGVKTAELEETENRLADTEDSLADTREKLADTRDELSDTRIELTDTKNELLSTATRLNSTEFKLTSAEAKLEETQADLTIARDTLGGLGITLYDSSQCYDVKLVDNPEAHDPTWQELLNFLVADQTDKNDYILDVYDCSQFSRDIHNNAEAAGIRAAEVQVDWSNYYTAHALNAFLTTDLGLVYIDCTANELSARVKVGKTYRGTEIFNINAYTVRNDVWWDNLSSYYYMSAGSAGQAMTGSIKIYW